VTKCVTKFHSVRWLYVWGQSRDSWYWETHRCWNAQNRSATVVL